MITLALNEETLNQHLETAVTDFGAAFHVPLVVIGDKLGLYRALDKSGPLTSTALAARAIRRDAEVYASVVRIVATAPGAKRSP